jgi:hypothetical protein
MVAFLEAAGSSTRGSGWAPRRQASLLSGEPPGAEETQGPSWVTAKRHLDHAVLPRCWIALPLGSWASALEAAGLAAAGASKRRSMACAPSMSVRTLPPVEVQPHFKVTFLIWPFQFLGGDFARFPYK